MKCHAATRDKGKGRFKRLGSDDRNTVKKKKRNQPRTRILLLFAGRTQMGFNIKDTLKVDTCGMYRPIHMWAVGNE